YSRRQVTEGQLAAPTGRSNWLVFLRVTQAGLAPWAATGCQVGASTGLHRTPITSPLENKPNPKIKPVKQSERPLVTRRDRTEVEVHRVRRRIGVKEG